MRATQVHHSSVSHASNGLSPGKELSRLITAAVVNREFCNLLLANPGMAVAGGYEGESFDLAIEEQELILSIRATSLADFAKQLTRNGNGHVNTNGFGQNHNGHNGNGQNGNNGYNRGFK